jgi:selenoprotein W-related protein
MADLLDAFEAQIESITLIPSSGGRFEVVVNEILVYSKLETGRFMEAGEAVRLISKFIQDGHQ